MAPVEYVPSNLGGWTRSGSFPTERISFGFSELGFASHLVWRQKPGNRVKKKSNEKKKQQSKETSLTDRWRHAQRSAATAAVPPKAHRNDP